MVSAEAVIERLEGFADAMGELMRDEPEVPSVESYCKGFRRAMAEAVLVIRDEKWPSEEFE